VIGTNRERGGGDQRNSVRNVMVWLGLGRMREGPIPRNMETIFQALDI